MILVVRFWYIYKYMLRRVVYHITISSLNVTLFILHKYVPRCSLNHHHPPPPPRTLPLC